jgi:hypothetical protein
MRIATSDATRPIPENRAIEASSLHPDFSDETNDAEIGAAIRMTVGMSNLQWVIKNPGPHGSPRTANKGSTHLAQSLEIRPADEGTDRHNRDLTFSPIVPIGFMHS